MTGFQGSRVLPAFLLLLTACASQQLPEGNGEGLVAWDREPPPGAVLVERPTWTVGDRFAYQRGGEMTVAYRVTKADEDGFSLVEEETGMVLDLTPDLAERVRRVPTRPDSIRVRDPADHELVWPLWVGKRWTCHYVEKRPGEDALPVRVHSRCEAEESIDTSSGATLRCLRIVRTAHLEMRGHTFLDRTAVLYYSPEAGWWARRIEDGILSELTAHHRQKTSTGEDRSRPSPAR